MSVSTKVGIVGILALTVVIAVTQSDIWNWNQQEGDGEEVTVKISDTPVPDKELKFRVALRNHYPLGQYKNPASTAIQWAIGAPTLVAGSENPDKARWERVMGKYPPGTKYWLAVVPGNRLNDNVTTQVWVYVDGVEVCGPVIDKNRVVIYDPTNKAYTKGIEVAKCEGFIP